MNSMAMDRDFEDCAGRWQVNQAGRMEMTESREDLGLPTGVPVELLALPVSLGQVLTKKSWFTSYVMGEWVYKGGRWQQYPFGSSVHDSARLFSMYGPRVNDGQGCIWQMSRPVPTESKLPIKIQPVEVLNDYGLPKGIFADSKDLQRAALEIQVQEDNRTSHIPETKGLKFDDGKPQYDLIPVDAQRTVVEVLSYGARKYDRFNWEFVENADSRYYNACLRHLEAWRAGEWLDSKEKGGSGLPHLAHAICCLLFLLAINLRKMAGDTPTA